MILGILGVNSISTIILQIAKEQFESNNILFIDDNPEKLGTVVNGIKVGSTTQDWDEIVQRGGNFQMAISLGEKHLVKRKQLFHKFNKFHNLHFPVFKHQTAIISELATIEDGNVLSFGVIIGHNTYIKSNSVFWSGVIVEHDCIIGESCYLAPNVTISGFVKIGDSTLIGSGAVILPEIEIGTNCLIGAGSVVTKNIPDNSVVAGVPAKIIRQCK